MYYNRIVIIGRLTRDPEYAVTPSGVEMTKFTIAVDRPQSAEARQRNEEKKTDFIDVITWRQLAQSAGQLLQKGKLTLVEGRLEIRSYQTQDGQNRKAAEVIADTFRILERRDANAEGGDDMGGGYAAPAPAQSRGGYDQGGYSGGNQGGGRAPAPAQSRGGYDRNAAPQQSRGGRNPQPQADLGDDFDDPFAGE